MALCVLLWVAAPVARVVCGATCAPVHVEDATSCHATAPESAVSISVAEDCRGAAPELGLPQTRHQRFEALAASIWLSPQRLDPSGDRCGDGGLSRTSRPPNLTASVPLRI